MKLCEEMESRNIYLDAMFGNWREESIIMPNLVFEVLTFTWIETREKQHFEVLTFKKCVCRNTPIKIVCRDCALKK